MRIVYFILLFLFWAFPGYIFGQDAKCHRSTEGTDFWFGFMEGRNDNGNVHYIEITVTARQASNFKIYIGKSQIPFKDDGFVNANSSVQIRIPLELGEATGSESKQERGIHLVAENPVNVYALNWDRNSADVAVMYPVESLGKEYFTMCYTPKVDSDPDHGRNSEFLIVATEDNTSIEITPSVVTDAGKPADATFLVSLNRGEVYQVQSLNLPNLSGQGDLTGSYIKSNKPIAVYSGNFSTSIPAEPGVSGTDHLFEQMPPLQTWGREYYAVPLLNSITDRYRVMASEDSTTVMIGNATQIIANSGNFIEFTLNYNQPTRIFANKPIMVAQFSQSRNTNVYINGEGDPFMIILSPISQTKNEATFVAYDSEQIENYYINIVTLTSQKGNIELDGNKMTELFKPFVGTDYSYTQIKTFSGIHTIKNLDPDMGFLAYVYGFGGFESYGYGVGFNLDLVLDLGYEEDTIPLCNGESIVLDAGPYFDSYLWSTGETTQKITVTKTGKYLATGSTVDGCTQNDSIYMLVSNPEKPILGEDLQGCSPYEISLDAGAGYVKYDWNTGDSKQIIDANQTGQYSVKVYDKYGCYKSDTMNLTVFPVPTISMIGENISCGTKTRKLDLQFDGADENMIQNGDMDWKCDNPNLSFSNQTNTSADINVTEWGIYDIQYKFVTPDGCIKSDTLHLEFRPKPTSDFNPIGNSNSECAGYTQILQYVGNATSSANYFWDYGGCTVIDSTIWNQREISLGIFGSVPVVTLRVEENGCWSEPDSLEIKANPNFKMNTEKSTGCDSATIQFSGELITIDSLKFEWDFGDGSLIDNDPNPSHKYNSVGKYHVGLVITNQINGCKVGYTIDEMVKIFPTPAVDIVVDSAFCNDKTVDMHYLQNIDSSFCNWDFNGTAHIISGENDSITAFLDKQIATIRLQVEEYGCLSDWAEATAKRKPIFDFSTNVSDGCQPLQILATASTSDENISFKWLTDSLITTGDEQIFILQNIGQYDFTVAATSTLTGCNDTLIKLDFVEVHPKPETQFTVDYPVATIANANLHFTNQTPEVQKFNWDFGDGANSVEENPQHTYTLLGKFPVELIVESEFGCIDTGMMEIEIASFDVYTPNAFRPDSDIPENREFMPISTGVDHGKFQLQIYNRWGELVFESKSPEDKWDGTTKNGNPAPVGNYVWKSDFTDIQGLSHSLKGQVLLIR